MRLLTNWIINPILFILVLAFFAMTFPLWFNKPMSMNMEK